MKKFTLIAMIFAVALTLVPAEPNALRITLKRVVFEGPKRAEVLTIINNTDKQQTYRLGWRHFRMTPDKSLVHVPDDQLTADIKPVTEMVRFAPRRFTVGPKSSQQVRMMLRTPSDLADGEYRSHFWIRPEADVEELRREAEEQNQRLGRAGGVSMKMLAGVTMPVIVRKGNLEASATIPNLQARETGGFIDVQYSLLREGTRSTYGEVDFVCNPGTASEYLLRTMRGIALYMEINQRDFEHRLEKIINQPTCETLSVTYSETAGFKGEKVNVLDQKIVTVN